MNVKRTMAALGLVIAVTTAGGSVAGAGQWGPPQAVVPRSALKGVHGLAVLDDRRVLAGTVVGNAIWEIDRASGAAKIYIPGPEGQADDIAIGPKGELAWTSYLQGIVRFREKEGAPIRVLAFTGWGPVPAGSVYTVVTVAPCAINTLVLSSL